MSGNVSWREVMPELELLEREPLRAHTTFRVGGPARWFLRPKDEAEAAEILRRCHEAGIKPFFLGNGSNVLAADDGFDGVVVSTAGLDNLTLGENGAIVAGSGVSLARLANVAAQNALTGLEFAQGSRKCGRRHADERGCLRRRAERSGPLGGSSRRDRGEAPLVQGGMPLFLPPQPVL